MHSCAGSPERKAVKQLCVSVCIEFSTGGLVKSTAISNILWLNHSVVGKSPSGRFALSYGRSWHVSEAYSNCDQCLSASPCSLGRIFCYVQYYCSGQCYGFDNAVCWWSVVWNVRWFGCVRHYSGFRKTSLFHLTRSCQANITHSVYEISLLDMHAGYEIWFPAYILKWLCLQCFDAVAWAAGRASGL